MRTKNLGPQESPKARKRPRPAPGARTMRKTNDPPAAATGREAATTLTRPPPPQRATRFVFISPLALSLLQG
jgi:hypothetical protein